METLNALVLTFVLNAAWQVTLMGILAVLCGWLLKDAPGCYQHRLYVASLVLGALLPLAGLRHLETSGPLSASAGVTAKAEGASVRNLAGLPTQGTVQFAWPLGWLAAATYLLTLVYQCGRLTRASARTLLILRSGRRLQLPETVASAKERCRQELGLEDIPILSTPSVSGPVTIGIRHPVILLPETFGQTQSLQNVTSALGHEMAHVRRRDFALNLVYELLYVPLSFHPAAWLLRRGIRRTRELACDEMVTERLVDSRTYARSIVEIAESMVSPRPPGYALGVFDADNFSERIRRLTDTKPRAAIRPARRGLLTGALLLAAAGLVGAVFTLRPIDGLQVPPVLILRPPPPPPPPPPTHRRREPRASHRGPVVGSGAAPASVDIERSSRRGKRIHRRLLRGQLFEFSSRKSKEIES